MPTDEGGRLGMIKMKNSQIDDFQRTLVSWYHIHGRDLPWRRSRDPYTIWVSEIMLQQTQVETVKAYYIRFLEKYPDVCSLAQANEDEVFKLWEGLGYYRRASNMLQAAKTIAEDFDGHFPENYDDIIKLKGIGAYTASAISSIAFGLPKGVVDGNTLRIISRLYNRQDNIADERTKKAYQEVMDTLAGHSDPSDLNQAMMDLGAMICTPKQAKCDICPVSEFCDAKKCGTVSILPVNIKKRTKTDVEWMTAVITCGGKYLMVKNPDGLLQNLYGLVQYEVDTPAAFETRFFENYGVSLRLKSFGKTVKHVFSHKVWYMNVYEGEIEKAPVKSALPFGLFSPGELIRDVAVSTAHQKALRCFADLFK